MAGKAIQRNVWRDECFRLRALCKTYDKETADEALTADDVIDILKDHRFTHADWATWFEANPDDPRATDGVGDAAFHRAAVARYDRMIAAVARLRDEKAGLVRAANALLTRTDFWRDQERAIPGEYDDLAEAVARAQADPHDSEGETK